MTFGKSVYSKTQIIFMVYKVNRLMQETCPIVALQLFFFYCGPWTILGPHKDFKALCTCSIVTTMWAIM